MSAISVEPIATTAVTVRGALRTERRSDGRRTLLAPIEIDVDGLRIKVPARFVTD